MQARTAIHSPSERPLPSEHHAHAPHRARDEDLGAPIRTEVLRANGLDFETDIAGGGARLALLLHGFPESKRSWRHQLPHLARLGYTAWAPNLRGYGRSSRPSGLPAYHVDRLLEDVAGLVDLAAARGHRGVTLIAHDWGGLLAWFFALRALRPLDGLVVINLPHPRRIVEGLRTAAQLRRSWYLFFFQLPVLPEWIMTRDGAAAIPRLMLRTASDPARLCDEALEELRKNALEPGAMRAMLAYYRSLGRDAALRREALRAPRLALRTLLVFGEDDVYLGRELLRGTAALVSDVTIRLLPGVSHWAQQEAPEQVNALLTGWLRP